MGGLVSVTLSGPAKIAGRYRKVGDVVEVSSGVLDDLRAAGALSADDVVVAELVAEMVPGAPGFDAAVAAQAELIAKSVVDAAVSAALTEIIADRDNAAARASNAEVTITRQDTRIYELEAQVADLEERLAQNTPPDDGKPVEQAAKPAVKSGAAKKG